MADRRVFITHASVDRALAEALVAYVRLATGLGPNEVFCTSIDGYGIPTGQRFMSFIRKQLRNTKLVVPLVTPAYLDSIFCQWELGAVWVRRDLPIFPIKVDGVSHERLPAPLAELQIAGVERSGLAELARKVSSSFGLPFPGGVAGSAADDLLASYPAILASLESAWESTPQARLRRESRYAHASSYLHRAFHLERDASFLQVLHAARDGARTGIDMPSPDLTVQFMDGIRAVLVELDHYFSTVTGRPCRMTLKQFLEVDGDYYVQDVARSKGAVRPARDPITGNTDFEIILHDNESFFWSNDLVGEVSKGYENTHGVPGVGLAYRSTIVWPIRKRLANAQTAARIGSPLADHDLLGFLCVDSPSAGAFIDADFQIGAAVADSLYAVLRPYLMVDPGARRPD